MDSFPLAGAHWLPSSMSGPFRPTLEQDRGVALLYFAAVVEQLQARGKRTQRVLLVGEHAVYLCNPGADIVRCLHLADLQSLVFAKDQWVALVGRDGGDIVLKIVSSVDPSCTLHHLADVISVAHRTHTDADLSVRAADCDVSVLVLDLALQLAPPTSGDDGPVSFPIHILPYETILNSESARDVLAHLSEPRRGLVQQLRSRLQTNVIVDPSSSVVTPGSPFAGIAHTPQMKLFRSKEWQWDWATVQGPPAIYTATNKHPMPALTNSQHWFSSQLSAVGRAAADGVVRLAPQRIAHVVTASMGSGTTAKTSADAAVQVAVPAPPSTPSKEEIALKQLMRSPLVEQLLMGGAGGGSGDRARTPSQRYLQPFSSPGSLDRKQRCTQ